ncbi:MAG: B12-binding domain-containing radical SAM protein [Syntrophobacteraceae bacterium]|nr:B12-binding domain-containing radical SAM protein [Syntrophobacteraceae bacterium]
MKILFLYPNANSQLGFNYGVAHMSAVLKEAGHHVEFRQLCDDLGPLPSREEFTRYLEEVRPDLIGFSVVTNQWSYAQTLARWAREAVAAPLVIGGIHATVAAREILETRLFDYVFRGECEEAFLEFVEKFDRGEDLYNIPNLALVHQEAIRINPMRRLPDLAALPPKDYKIFNFQEMIDAKGGWVGLMGSRGCPFSCTYCFNHQMVDQYRMDLRCGFRELGYIRHFPVDQVIAEIEYLLKNYRNIRMFIFDDDLFTYRKSYVKDFCREYRRVSDIPFVVNAHVGFFDEDRARYLAEANCRIVKFGVESGNERVRRRIMNRYTSNDKILQSIRIARDFGLHTSIFLMIGLPFETREDVMDTIRLTATAGPGRFRWSFFFPFPGTRAYELSLEGGYIDREKMNTLMNFTDSSCLRFGEKHDLFLEKVGRVLPWFVNAYSDLPVREYYRERVEKILALSSSQWRQISPTLLDEDRILSEAFAQKGLPHYAVKYNRFMGVISDYFLQDRE